jgi:hypothetical protein
MAILPPVFRPRYFSASGLPLSGGKLYTYEAGTTTPLATYTDATETSANTNPIILDANGECNLWLGGNAYKIVLTDSADVTQWTQDNINQGQINNAVSADLLENLGITFTPANSPTITVKTGAGNTPSLSDPVRVGFRGGSLASGLVSLVNITSPLAMNISSDATLGHSSGVTAYVYVYLINNNGVAELAVSSTIYQENALISTTAMSSSADSAATIYSTTARTSVPIRLIARITSNQVTAGSWIAAPTEIQTGEEARRAQINTSQIADLAVTTAKLADSAVTNAKRSAINIAESSVISSVNITTTSYSTVGTISSFTSTGKACVFGLRANVDGAYLLLDTVSASSCELRMRVYDVTNSAEICFLGRLRLVGSTGDNAMFTLPSTITALTAGTREIRLEARLEASGSSRFAGFVSLVFYAQEL